MDRQVTKTGKDRDGDICLARAIRTPRTGRPPHAREALPIALPL